MKRFSKVYITLDIDCLDPAYAAGTGTPQFGGLTARQLLDLLKGLFDGLNIIGMDVVEVAPDWTPLWRRCSRPGKLLPSAGPTTTSKTSPVRKQREED
ncbi:MAG: arginase family protein [Flavonifractor plautii]